MRSVCWATRLAKGRPARDLVPRVGVSLRGHCFVPARKVIAAGVVEQATACSRWFTKTRRERGCSEESLHAVVACGAGGELQHQQCTSALAYK